MPGPYRVETRPRVRRDLRKLDEAARGDVLSAMRALTDNPRPAGVRPLKGHRPWLRIRVGDYRIVFTVDHEIGLIEVSRIGPRGRVYREL